MNSKSWKENVELIGIVAVVASLILVAFELRQNTNAVQATAVQEATTVARDQILMSAQDPDIVRIGMTPYSELSEIDQRRAFWIDRSYWIGMQGLYRQYELGTLPVEEWQFWERVICANYLNRDSEELWSGNAATLAQDFVNFVEGCTTNVVGVIPQ
ncbi:MAG: hypothetical protein GWN81_07675 [Phycisphaerae bacterium]|nr:hypothetical protein [Phycisphaerae bacterium]